MFGRHLLQCPVDRLPLPIREYTRRARPAHSLARSLHALLAQSGHSDLLNQCSLLRVAECPEWYLNDDGDLVNVRYENWKVVFEEQRATGTLRIWGEPFTRLRLPKVFDLRSDPYERADDVQEALEHAITGFEKRQQAEQERLRERERFETDWARIRTAVVLPALEEVAVLLRKAGWQCALEIKIQASISQSIGRARPA